MNSKEFKATSWTNVEKLKKSIFSEKEKKDDARKSKENNSLKAVFDVCSRLTA